MIQNSRGTEGYIVENLPPSWQTKQLMLSGVHGALRDIFCIFKQICALHLFFYLHAWQRSLLGAYIWTFHSDTGDTGEQNQALLGSLHFRGGKKAKSKKWTRSFQIMSVWSDSPTKHIRGEVGAGTHFTNILTLHCNLVTPHFKCMFITAWWPSFFIAKAIDRRGPKRVTLRCDISCNVYQEAGTMKLTAASHLYSLFWSYFSHSTKPANWIRRIRLFSCCGQHAKKIGTVQRGQIRIPKDTWDDSKRCRNSLTNDLNWISGLKN